MVLMVTGHLPASAAPDICESNNEVCVESSLNHAVSLKPEDCLVNMLPTFNLPAWISLQGRDKKNCGLMGKKCVQPTF